MLAADEDTQLVEKGIGTGLVGTCVSTIGDRMDEGLFVGQKWRDPVDDVVQDILKQLSGHLAHPVVGIAPESHSEVACQIVTV
jgi:hypothetical protein